MSKYVDFAKRRINALLGRFGYHVSKVPEVWWWEPIGLDGLIPPRNLWVGSNDPLYWFFGYMWEYRAYLTLLCELRKDASVLELGCSHGRTMLALIGYLEPPGRYEGLDILAKQIEFAQNHIHSRYNHFNFTLSDVYNGLYNPQGRQRADSYRFPYGDDSFDVVYAASLFTHLLPPDAANYLRESRRVLREGGRCLFSFFLLDYYKGPATHYNKGPGMPSTFEFEHKLNNFDGFAVYSREKPEWVVAYEISRVERMAAEAGLTIKRIIPGFWSKTRMNGVNEQDLILFEVA